MDRIKAYIKRGREIEAKATPGPWHIGHIDESLDHAELESPDGRVVAEVFPRWDQGFIAHARNHHARLLDALEEALRQRDWYREHTIGSMHIESRETSKPEDDARIAAILEGKP